VPCSRRFQGRGVPTSRDSAVEWKGAVLYSGSFQNSLSGSFQSAFRKLSKRFQEAFKTLSGRFQNALRKLSKRFQEAVKTLSGSFQEDFEEC
jgi:hypothetical protein